MKTTLIAITGPSGFNKSHLVREALSSSPDKFAQIIAYTDRPPKEGEVEGYDFKFISEDEFTRMIESERFMEWQRLLSNNFRYGKTKEDFEKTLKENEGKVIFTNVNVINLPLLKRSHPEIKSIFVDVKDTNALIDFLRNSPDVKSEEEYDRRFKFATEERRRRHLADVTMHMHEDFKDSYEEFMKIIANFSN